MPRKNMKIAVYGSLKKGKYNHDLLGDAKFLGDIKVKGTLYLVSTYPVLLQGENEYDAEVYDVPEHNFNTVSRMEVMAGYVPTIVSTEYGDVIVYYGGDYYKANELKQIEKYV